MAALTGWLLAVLAALAPPARATPAAAPRVPLAGAAAGLPASAGGRPWVGTGDDRARDGAGRDAGDGLATGPRSAGTRPGPHRGAGWGWPLHPARPVVAGFRAPSAPWAPGHRGVDLPGGPGEPVLAPAAGVVAFSGPVAGRGVVVLRHAGGLRSSMEPVQSPAPVGTRADRGEQVAVLAAPASHCSPRTCLHWGVRRDGAYLDPLTLLGSAPAVLLPLHRPPPAAGLEAARLEAAGWPRGAPSDGEPPGAVPRPVAWREARAVAR